MTLNELKAEAQNRLGQIFGAVYTEQLSIPLLQEIEAGLARHFSLTLDKIAEAAKEELSSVERISGYEAGCNDGREAERQRILKHWEGTPDYAQVKIKSIRSLLTNEK